MRRHPSRLVAWCLVVVTVCVGTAMGVWAQRRDVPAGQALRIPGASTYLAAPWPAAIPGAGAGGRPFLASVAPDGRYFLDQYGQPFLVRGDAPWSLMTDLSPPQAELYLSTREQQGFNAVVVSLLGSLGNGGPHDDGRTHDGVAPFDGGDVLRWNEPYWERMTSYLRMAADHGITVFLYVVDGWTIGRSFVPRSIDQCTGFGRRVGERFADLPNIVWVTGGDYAPATDDLAAGSDVDRCWDAVMRGIRETGDGRPFSIQLDFDESISSDNPFWAPRLDWEFVYTYHPTYTAVLEAYGRSPARPVVLGEANYERENNQPESAPTTDETLRRQVLWSLTSGAAGEVMGSHDWDFPGGWETRLATPAVEQVGRLRELFAALRWWELVPDRADDLVTAGRGLPLEAGTAVDVLDDDYVTAARTPDGAQAVVYLPSARTISVDTAVLAEGVHVAWVDPASGQRTPVPVSSIFTTPGRNDGGDEDWVLLFTA
ncbi:DUF4038 domain-containing protein [Trujillonella endophytica]|uniref:Putative collagen-binding domain of a collagenase n=1 Tax=Trujillonella endophytica TaxID=673521 RepID=A0A1H8W0Q6_9ACTN|nr:DUF4038 domain-containing protein [Trujillella endophytica]SEP21164.1 Putative collagen-binding domain of a collagenase [Trujillella endophytica]